MSKKKKSKVPPNYKSYSNVRYCKSDELENIYVERSGVIPYCVNSNAETFLLLARHLESGELGDFGGGVKGGENALEGAFREFTEESHGLFDDQYQSPEDMKDCISIIEGNKMAITFVPVTFFSVLTAEKRYKMLLDERQQKFGNKIREEISEIIWVNKIDFCVLVATNKLWCNKIIESNDDTEKLSPVLWKKVRIFFRKVWSLGTIIDSLCPTVNAFAFGLKKIKTQ